MARKKTGKSAKKTPWEIAWELRTYPAQLPEAKHKNMTRADVVFALMMWLGMSKIDAYLTAYPTNASRVSVAAMATRKSQEEWITDYLDALWKAETDGKIKFNPLPYFSPHTNNAYNFDNKRNKLRIILCQSAKYR